MKTIKRLGLLGLAITLTGCGNDVEFKAHGDNNMDFSSYEGALLDANKIKGSFLDREYVSSIVSQISAAESAVGSRSFVHNTQDPVAELDKHIKNLSAIKDVDTTRLVERVKQYKTNIEQHLKAQEQRKQLTIERLEKDIKPLFADLDTKTAKLNEHKAFLKVASADFKTKDVAYNQHKQTAKELLDKANKAIDQHIIDNELPISVNKVGVDVDFSNIENFRNGHTCNKSRKEKADYRGTLMKATGGETICVYEYEYNLSYNKYTLRLDEKTKADLDAIVAKAEAADREHYIKLGYAENLRDQAWHELRKKETIAKNKYGRSLKDAEYVVSSIKRNISRYPEGLINEDRTLNLESKGFEKAMGYTRGVQNVRINNDTRVFKDYNGVSDRIYVKKIRQQLEQSLIPFAVEESGFDLPNGVEQANIAYLFISTSTHVSGQKSAYLWNGSALANSEGELRLHDNISLYSNSKSGALDRIHQQLF